MTKFNVGDKVIFNKENTHVAKQFDYKINKPYEVQEVFPFHHTVQIINEKGSSHSFDEERFELVETKPTKNQRITALENEVAELKLIVHELRERPQLTTVINNSIQGPSTTNTVEDIIEFEGKQYRKVDREAREEDYVSVSFEEGKCFKPNKIYGPVFKEGNDLYVNADSSTGGRDYEEALVYNSMYNRTPETVDVYELIESKPLTPNQQRAAIIEKAKEFIDKHDKDTHINIHDNAIIAYKLDTADFGISKCNPSDVFNEHIGKAIALGRAFGIDVSEFEQAVQPIEIVKGMEIMLFNSDGKDHKSGVVETYNSTADEATFSAEKTYGPYAEKTGFSRCIREHGYKILNDTNAKYEVSSNE